MGDKSRFELLHLGFSELFSSGKYADLTIVCGEKTWNVHKVLLCSQSEFFAKACDGTFKEAQESRIDLSEDDSAAVHAMVEYFYKGYYTMPLRYCDTSDIVLLVKLCVLTDKYLLEHLRQYAIKELGEWMYSDWDEHGFADGIAAIYRLPSAKDDKMRKAAVRTTSVRAMELLGDDEKYAYFREVAWTIPEFTADVTRALAKAALEEPEPKPRMKGELCKECSKYEIVKVSPAIGNGYPWMCASCYHFLQQLPSEKT